MSPEPPFGLSIVGVPGHWRFPEAVSVVVSHQSPRCMAVTGKTVNLEVIEEKTWRLVQK